MNRHKPIDRNGARVSVGDIVRVIGVPRLDGMDSDVKCDVLPVFECVVGKYKKVVEFDKLGCAELTFVMRSNDGETTCHSVWIEPVLLHVKKSRRIE